MRLHRSTGWTFETVVVQLGSGSRRSYFHFRCVFMSLEEDQVLGSLDEGFKFCVTQNLIGLKC